MSNKQDQRNHYVTLQPRDKEDPFSILADYCTHDSLFNTRIEFFTMFSAAMCSQQLEADNPQQKAHRMWFFEQGIKLIESIYLIYELHITGQLVYKIKLNE
jgi:hypothetical protein